MGWVRIDDHFNEHPKLAQVGPLGWGVWVAGLAYCNRNLTDGFIPRAAAISLGCFEIEVDGELYDLAVTSGMADADLTTSWVIDLLVTAGLWKRIKGGYRVHDYHDYQPTKERVLAERERSAKRQQRFRNGTRNGVTHAETNPDTNAVSDGHVTVAPTPTLNNVKTSSSDADRADEKATEDDIRLCKLLGQLAKERNPKFKVRSRSRWLTDMRLLRDRDGNTPTEIERVIRWVFRDEFWGGVIQSPGNLREHFPKIWDRVQAASRLRAIEGSDSFVSRLGGAA